MDLDFANNDVLDQYITISNKLKKRFLKKPNVAEACESFIGLAKRCETLELPVYAGLSWIAAARCEGSLCNNTGETTCLTQSARQLLKAEDSDRQIICETLFGENLQAGLSCYAHAASRFGEKSIFPLCIDLEIVDFLKRIDKIEYIESYLKDAIELSKGHSYSNIHCLELIASHFIKVGDYLAALETFFEISKLIENSLVNGSKSDKLLTCEINCVFLLLILRPSPQKLTPNLTKILEKYTWDDFNDGSLTACRMSESMFYLLRSLVTVCQSLDRSSLIDLETDFWKVLSKEQKELLRILLKIYDV
ncbi:40-kDa huntingtin-associated protein-like isoform X1 [Diorhabda carinulata]|uniref:40-kDa huntingtin-associated protein-like isoform X1 n=1 Tax=Diorhabda carinulata TaxID=1163345 RepID=UPI0025A00542|nr:40-kDa huntingtin-associated protein-like isoform X1 [Diorhabda carinulata]